MTSRQWHLRLGRIAERDLIDIFNWTRDHFGIEQARRYRTIIFAAMKELGDGPDGPGARHVPEVHPDARILHIARHGRRARHFLLYKSDGAGRIIIGRILHDAMDIDRHVPTDDDW